MNRVVFLLSAWALLNLSLSAHAGGADVCAAPVQYRSLSGTPAANAVTGGTGIGTDAAGGIGGTGIVGTITGFASICINGLEVHYDDTVPVSENGKPATARGLAVGQLVVVEAGNSARGLEARQIAIVHALEGPVTRAANADGQIEVMGARVSPVSAATLNQTRRLKAGDWVQVSGHPAADGGVVASRVATIDVRPLATVSGLADPATQRVGGVAVDRKGSGDLTVRGQWDGKQLAVRDSRPSAGAGWTTRPAWVIIETRVRQYEGKEIRTGRADVDAALARQGEPKDGERLSAGTLIRMTARIDADGKLHPIRIERAENGQRRETGGESSRGDDDRSGKDGTRNDEDRAARDAREAIKKQEKLSEKLQRAEREQIERTNRAEREKVERAERIDRPERVDRSGRDHCFLTRNPSLENNDAKTHPQQPLAACQRHCRPRRCGAARAG